MEIKTNQRNRHFDKYSTFELNNKRRGEIIGVWFYDCLESSYTEAGENAIYCALHRSRLMNINIQGRYNNNFVNIPLKTTNPTIRTMGRMYKILRSGERFWVREGKGYLKKHWRAYLDFSLN